MEVGEKCVTTVCEFNPLVLLEQEPFLHSERFHMCSFEEAIVSFLTPLIIGAVGKRCEVEPLRKSSFVCLFKSE